MNKQVIIVGIGPGNRNYILPVAVEALNDADFILGFGRAAEALSFLGKGIIKVSSLKEIIELVEKKQGTIAVAASGDPCFYGVTEYLKSKLEEDIVVIPGLSSFQYLTAKLKKTWSTAFLGSLHGRSADFLKVTGEHKLSIWLVDKNNSPNYLCETLIENNIMGRVYVGENLSYEDERIIEGTPKEIALMEFNSLSVFIFEKTDEVG